MAEVTRDLDRTRDMAIVLTTLPDLATGEEVVRTLVEEGTIACGNLIPGLLSIYRWENELAREEEVLVVMKTAAAGVDRLFGRITELHPYAVPELVELSVGSAAGAYSRWVIENTKVVA